MRARAKRGGGIGHTSLTDRDIAVEHDATRLLDLDAALQRLAAVDVRLARVVECRYFGGLSEEDTAAALGVSLRTVQRDWLKARAWLRAALVSRL